MVHANAVDFEEMRGKLLTIDDVRDRLAETETERESAQVFEPPAATIRYDGDWAAVQDETALTGAYLRISGTGQEEYQLTKQAALEVGAACRVPRGLQQDWPVDMLTSVVNRSLAERITNMKEMKLLVRPGGDTHIGAALTRATVEPFSNLEILDILLAGITRFYGDGEVLADYKFSHTPELTNVRLIVPGQCRLITGTRVQDDSWSAGLQFRNSLTATKQTAVSPYLFRWWCTNGCTDQIPGVGASLDRRDAPAAEDAYEWARRTVEQVLGGLESSFDMVQHSAQQTVAADQVAAVVRDLFAEHGLPGREQQRVISELADAGEDMTLYDIVGAVTVVANTDTSPKATEQLLSIGGHIARSGSGRCDACHRVLPEGFSAN